MARVRIIKALQNELSEETTDAGRRLTELLGEGEVAEDLLRHEPHDGGFLIGDVAELLEADNAFVAAMSTGGPTSTILQALTSTWFLCEIPHEGDCLMAHTPAGAECTEIVYWSHEEHCFYGPIAWDVATPLRVMSVYESGDDAKKRARALKPALKRFDNQRWPLSFIEEQLIDDGVLDGPAPPPKARQSNFTLIHDRAFWLAQALAGHRVSERALEPQLSWQPTNALNGPWLRRYAPTALYWVFRSWLLNEAWLDEVLDAVRDAPSRLVRDAVALIDEINDDEDAGRDVAGVDLVDVRAQVIALKDKILDPFPDDFTVGPVTFVRDDSRVTDYAPADPMPAAPRPLPGQPLNPNWNENAPVLAKSPDGTRLLVQGYLENPDYGKNPYAKRSDYTVHEIDADGQVHFSAFAERSKAASYVGDAILCVGDYVELHQRRGNRGYRTHRARCLQEHTLFFAGGRAILQFGGAHNYDVGKILPRTVDLLSVDGAALRRVAGAEVPVAAGGVVGDEVVLVDEDRKVAYVARVDDFDKVPTPPTGVVLHVTALEKDTLSPRIGPRSVTSELSFNDWCHQSVGGSCLILRHKGGTEFESLVGDAENGIRPTDPPLSATMGGALLDAQHGGIWVDGQVWVFDLTTGKGQLAVQHDSGYDVEMLADLAFAKIRDDQLVQWRPDGDQYIESSILVGPGAEIITNLAGGRFLVLKARRSPLVVLGLADDGSWRLLGAASPDDPIASAKIDKHENPRSIYTLVATIDGQEHELVGLGPALDAASSEPLRALPEAPWEVCELRKGTR